eukprot:COSAG04_NODE_269_length_18509_cov_13.576480_8_plen_103_part_00
MAGATADGAVGNSRLEHGLPVYLYQRTATGAVGIPPLAPCPDGITKVLNRIGRKHRGKPFGSSILRHSYLSHKYGKVNEDKEKDADIMGHSVSTQTDYVKKD